jgi:hypothetical protein
MASILLIENHLQKDMIAKESFRCNEITQESYLEIKQKFDSQSSIFIQKY